MEEKEKKVTSGPLRDEKGRFVKRTKVEAPKKEEAKDEKVVKETKKAEPKKATKVETKEPAKKETETAKVTVKKEEKTEAAKVSKAEPKKAAIKKEAEKVETKTSSKKPAESAPKAKDSAKSAPKEARVVARLEQKYRDEVVPALIKEFSYTTIMQVPKLNKIVINMGVGDAITNAKNMEDAVRELSLIAGQQPVVTKAKKSIANYKLREGHQIGCKVTLRGIRMYDFLDKLISIALPRVRDFRGVSKNSFDGHGNYSLGVREQLIFPEISFDDISKIRGMDITIVTTAQTDKEAFALLKHLGMPFKR